MRRKRSSIPDYWRIIRIRKTVILAVFLLVAITTTLVTLFFQIFLQHGSNEGRKGCQRWQLRRAEPPAWLRSVLGANGVRNIQSKLILNQVITNLTLNRKWAEKMKVDELPTDLSYSILKHMTDVRQSRNTSLIEIRVISEDRNEAAVIANEIAKVYKNTRLKKGWRQQGRHRHTQNRV